MRPAAALASILLTATTVAAQSTPAGDLQSQISQLAALDYSVRMNAARLVRRAPVSEVVPALTNAVKSHPDEFVRYRALVVLTAFNDRGTGQLMRSLLSDRNDRLREVAYKWLEQRPDPAMRFPLLSALQTEQAEFVRPALVAALAALGDDAEVQRTLTVEVTRGLDLFRSAAIDTLGHHRAAYAVEAIAGVAANDGPLQADAVLALGRIGGPRARTALMGITNAPADLRLTIRGAQCLLGDNCDDALKALQDAAMAPKASTSIVRAAAQALSAISADGSDAAMASLVALSGRGGAVRDAAALAVAGAALRKPDRMLAWLNTAPEGERVAAVSLLKDGFESLEEDFAEEQFFAAARASYWSAAENSAARGLAADLIQALEF